MIFRTFRRQPSFVWWDVALVCAVFCLSYICAAAPGESVTLKIPTGDMPKLAGIELQDSIDYGSFSLIRVPKTAVEKLKSRKAAILEETDDGLVGLQDHPFNTHHPLPVLKPELMITETPERPMLYLVQLKGPAKPEWLTRLNEMEINIVSYIPQNTYLVWADPARVSALNKVSFVRWKGVYHPAYRIAKSLDKAKGEIEYLSVTIYGDRADEVINNIVGMGAKLAQKMDSALSSGVPMTTVLYTADASLIPRIAKLSKVIRIDRTSKRPGLDDEVACQITAGQQTGGVPYSNPSYASWLQQAGVTGAGSIAAVVDTGCDTNNNETVHLDLRGRLSTVIRYPMTPTTDMQGHGTHVAGILAGSAAVGTRDANGFLYGQGIAPGCSLVIQNAVVGQFPPAGDWASLTRDSYWAGAFVSNNSWYWDNTPGVGYTTVCQSFDYLTRDADPNVSGVQPIALVFSAGNGGPNPYSMYDPKEAKNIITVGASENYRLDTPLPGCGNTNNINGIADFSSRGPCVDGRLAPTIVAPGTSVSSAVSYSAAAAGSYNEPGEPCKALVNDDYAWMSGTSQSAPVVTGALALIAEWWRANHNGVNPGPAMCKAILVNSADNIAGGPDGKGGTLGHIPNNDQGWGRLNIAAAIAPPDTFYEDQAHIFTSTGQTRSYRVRVADPGKPLKITLAWSDAPGTPGANAWVNDLDLTVTSDTGTYNGNNFQYGWSILSPGRDHRNNIECVYLPSPSGIYWVTVTAANIAGDGVPSSDGSLDQDFAIVIRNGLVGGDLLEPYTPITKTTLALPDYYQAEVTGGGWSAVGVKATTVSDHDVVLYSDPGYLSPLASSTTRGSAADFVAVNGNLAPNGLVYPLVSTFGGKAGYRVEWATSTSDLIPGVLDVRLFDDTSVLRTWDIEVPGASSCGIRVQPVPGTLDIGVAIFASTAGISQSYYQSRDEALALSDAVGAGQAETLYFGLPTGGRYGVLVWNKSGGGEFNVLFDDDPPTIPVIVTSGSYTTDLTRLSASWSSSDPDTGIEKYEYAIGTSPGLTDVVPWTDVGSSTGITREGLSLIPGQTYYFSVRATNGLGMVSQGTGEGVLAVQAVSTIASAKALPNGIPILLTDKTVTAVFSGRFYICENDRSSGIGVLSQDTVTEGAYVTVIGTLSIAAGERVIEAIEVNP